MLFDEFWALGGYYDLYGSLVLCRHQGKSLFSTLVLDFFIKQYWLIFLIVLPWKMLINSTFSRHVCNLLYRLLVFCVCILIVFQMNSLNVRHLFLFNLHLCLLWRWLKCFGLIRLEPRCLYLPYSSSIDICRTQNLCRLLRSFTLKNVRIVF